MGLKKSVLLRGKTKDAIMRLLFPHISESLCSDYFTAISLVFLIFIKALNILSSLFVIKTYSKNKFKYIKGILFIFVIFIILSIFIALFGSGGLNAGLIR